MNPNPTDLVSNPRIIAFFKPIRSATMPPINPPPNWINEATAKIQPTTRMSVPPMLDSMTGTNGNTRKLPKGIRNEQNSNILVLPGNSRNRRTPERTIFIFNPDIFIDASDTLEQVVV